jgi:hypothetical protein
MFQLRKIQIKQNQRRHYHIYKIVGNILTLFEADVNLKKQINQTMIDKSLNKKMIPSTIFREIKRSKPLKDSRDITTVLEASNNIRRLCMDAYELCQSVKAKETRYRPSDEELMDFIELTNEMYPCIDKELYRKIKELKI